jgi:hypothetical protein
MEAYICAVKKGLAYIFFFLFLFNTPAFNQPFKLPVLIAHFLEHRQLDQSISFFDFLSMHYWNDINDDDQDRDNQLPFKSVEDFSALHTGLLVMKPLLLKPDLYELQVDQPLFREHNLPDPRLSSLFRPPRA